MKAYMNYKRIKQIGLITMAKLVKNDNKIFRDTKEERKRFKCIDTYLVACSEDLPYKSKNGLRIKMIEISFHELITMFPKEKCFLKTMINTTGAYATAYDLDNGKTIELVVINSDVYNNDLCPKYMKYFTIAHEIGHCINEDPLNMDYFQNKYGSDAYTENRSEIDECIEKELNADKTGYDEVIFPGWFGDFQYNDKLTLSRQYRTFQHRLNYITCLFGLENIDLLLEKTFKYAKDALDLSEYFVNFSLSMTSEDIRRKELFDSLF